MVYTGTEIAPGRAKFAGYTPIHGIHLYMVYTDSYTGTEGNPVNRRSLKRQRSIRSKETQWKSVASGGQPTQVRIQALEPRAEQIQTVGTENVESFLIESRVCTLYVYCMSAPRL